MLFFVAVRIRRKRIFCYYFVLVKNYFELTEDLAWHPGKTICKLNHLRAEKPPLPPRATRSPGVYINGGEGGGQLHLGMFTLMEEK